MVQLQVPSSGEGLDSVEKWEYLSIRLEWDDTANQYSVIGLGSTTELVGNSIGSALNLLGEEGWELVSFFVSDWRTTGRGMRSEAQAYRGILKRPKP